MSPFGSLAMIKRAMTIISNAYPNFNAEFMGSNFVIGNKK